MPREPEKIPKTGDSKVAKDPWPNEYASTGQKHTWSQLFPCIKLHNMDVSEDPQFVTEVCELLLEKLGLYDWRWTQLRNEIDRPNHRLWRSMFSWVKKKIQQYQNTVSQSSDSQNAISNADTARNTRSGQKSRKKQTLSTK